MRRNLLRALAVALVAVSVLVVTDSNSAGSAVVSPCLTAGAEATNAVSNLRQAVSYVDSAAAVNAGYPFKPANAAILADSAQCARIIQSFNTLFAPADSLKRIRSAYVAKAWPPSVYGLHWPATDSTLAETFVFDSVLVFKVRLSKLK